MKKKYIVRVQYTDLKSPDLPRPHDLVWLVKAKNDRDLENIMIREYSDSLSSIDGYEYERMNNPINKRFLKRSDFVLMCGTWVGAGIMEEDLKNLKERS